MFIGKVKSVDGSALSGWRRCAVVAVAIAFADGIPATGAPSHMIQASRAGARLDSDLMRGGGTDDTAAIQKVLDRARGGRAVHLIVDGPALVTGINVYGNTTIECVAGGGLYLKDKSSRSIIRNANRSRDAITDEHIKIRGCFLNGNRRNQPWAHLPWPEPIGFNLESNREADSTFISGVQFAGVKHLSLEGVIIWSPRAMGMVISNASHVDIRNVVVDHGEAEGPGITRKVINTDGLHFKGPLSHVTVDSVRLRVGDDGIAINANDFGTPDLRVSNGFGPYVGQGPIEDITINNVVLIDAWCGMKVLSSNQRVDRITVNNVTGKVKFGFLKLLHWLDNSGNGDFGKILISNVSVDRVDVGPTFDISPTAAKYDRGTAKFGGDGAGQPFILVDGKIESLRLSNIQTSVVDERPVLQIGPTAEVDLLDVELDVGDPKRTGKIIDTWKGGRIRQFDLALNWRRDGIDRQRDPFISHDAVIANMNWRNGAADPSNVPTREGANHDRSPIKR